MILNQQSRPSACRRSPPTRPPKAPTENGYVRCPRCGEFWTDLKWGDACPDCGAVRLRDGNWFPWGDER